MSDTLSLMPIRATLTGRWQIPLLGFGVLLLGTGLLRIASSHQPRSPEQELALAQRLYEAGALNRTNAYVIRLLKEKKHPPAHRGRLHRILARTAYAAERPMRLHKGENVRAVLSNMQIAMRLGVSLAPDDWIALGDAYRWSRNVAEALDAYRQALRLSPDHGDRIRRWIVELSTRPDQVLSADSLSELDAILTDESASPPNYLWALERKAGWLLDEGNADRAMGLVAEARKRLAGTAELPAVSYVEALCLRAGGMPVKAEALLRSLRNEWSTRDELWGKAGWLLGRLQQEDERPQAALSFYDDVLRSFQSGDLHDACEVGRAECLAMLERHPAALKLFTGIKDRLLSPSPPGLLDRKVIRATLTTLGLEGLGSQDLATGVDYLRLAMSLTDEMDAASRVFYMSRIADAQSRRARQVLAAGPEEPRPTGSEPRPSGSGWRSPTEPLGLNKDRSLTAKQLFTEAAEMYLALSELQTSDEEAAARAVELAADSFDSAGLEHRAIDLLARFVVAHPTSDRRLAALYRLGRAYQAARRYPDAIAAYEEAIKGYPRMPDALRSMVPLAQCLLKVGGERAQRGVDLLISIVDDRSDDPLFTPQAREYRDALFRLSEYYHRASEAEVPLHLERAIALLEDAVAFYPDDPEMPKLKFMLADGYRRSAALLRRQQANLNSAAVRENASAESNRRLRRALDRYSDVIAALAAEDDEQLTELERTHLRASYLYRGDCLFDLEDYERAIEAYREAAWRHENLPTAVSASMQIIHCYKRLGQTGEARTALARLRWLLAKIPPSAFDTKRGMSRKAYWEAMVKRLERSGVF